MKVSRFKYHQGAKSQEEIVYSMFSGLLDHFARARMFIAEAKKLRAEGKSTDLINGSLIAAVNSCIGIKEYLGRDPDKNPTSLPSALWASAIQKGIQVPPVLKHARILLNIRAQDFHVGAVSLSGDFAQYGTLVVREGHATLKFNGTEFEPCEVSPGDIRDKDHYFETRDYMVAEFSQPARDIFEVLDEYLQSAADYVISVREDLEQYVKE